MSLTLFYENVQTALNPRFISISAESENFSSFLSQQKTFISPAKMDDFNKLNISTYVNIQK